MAITVSLSKSCVLQKKLTVNAWQNYKISKSKENASDLKVEWKLIEGFDGIYSVEVGGKETRNKDSEI